MKKLLAILFVSVLLLAPLGLSAAAADTYPVTEGYVDIEPISDYVLYPIIPPAGDINVLGTMWPGNFVNWLFFIFLFGWIWMWFVPPFGSWNAR